jgi:hypothetical protein
VRQRIGPLLLLRTCAIGVPWAGLMASSWTGYALAQPAPGISNADYEREAENPVTHFYTLPLRYEASFDDGFYNAATTTLELSNAILPVPLDDDWFLITRTKGAFDLDAPKKRGESWENGLDNIETTLFLSPARGSGFFWGAGPVIFMPTATNSATGMNKWGSGPSLAAGWEGSVAWTVGFVANNVWSFGGPPHGSDRTNSLLLNPILSFRFDDGWSLSTSPNITSNWASDNNKRWTVPVGAGIGKAFKIANQPMSLKFESYYNVVRPGDHGSVWAVQLTLSLLFAR